MKIKITTILLTILFSLSVISPCLAGGKYGKNPRKAATFTMQQDDLNDPYRSNTEAVNKRFHDNQNFTNKKRDKHHVLLEELEY